MKRRSYSGKRHSHSGKRANTKYAYRKTLEMGIFALPTKIFVRDIGHSTAFYRDVIGFEQVFVGEEYGLARFQVGYFPIFLQQIKEGEATPTGDDALFFFTLYEEEFDTFANALAAKGVLKDGRLQRAVKGGTFAQVSDPDGNIIKIGRIARDWKPD